MTTIGIWRSGARAAFDEAEFARCVELCREALARQPDDGETWQLLGTACWELGLLDEAQEALETASCLLPLSPLAQLSLVEVYTRNRHLEPARAAGANLATREDCPVPLLPRVARGLGELGEHALALSVCERLAALRPCHHAAVFGIAFYRSALGDGPETVLPYLLRAFRMAPNTTTYRVSLACVLALLGRHGPAYELVRDVPPRAVSCRACVERLVQAFRHAGDDERVAEWAEWGERLEQ